MTQPTRRDLDCGTPLIVENIPGVRSAAMTWLIPAGSVTDDPDALGRSQVLSELLMRGGGGLDSRGQADAFDRLGVARNAGSGTTHIRLSVSSLGVKLREALPLLVDMVRRPTLSEASLAPTKDLAVQSIESLADDPQERCVLAARARHYPAPFDRSGLGTIEGIGSLTREGIVKAWETLARPGGSIIAAAGEVDADALATDLNTLLAGWTGEGGTYAMGTEAPRGYAHDHDDSNQVQILVVHDAPPEPHEDSVLERFVVNTLSGGMSGRLFTEVREKRGLCYSVSASYRADREFGGVSAYVGTTPERAQESLDVLLGELERVRGGITESELERARIGMKSRLVFGGESTGARAASLASDMRLLGRARSLGELTERIDRVSLDQVNAYLRRREPGRMTIQTVGPEPLRPPAGV